MNSFLCTRAAQVTALRLLFFLLSLWLGFTVHAQTAAAQDKPEAYLRFESQGAAPPRYYIEVYMKTMRVGGLGDIRASLRDTTGGKRKLLSTTVAASTEGDNNFTIPFSENEATILQQFSAYRVFVDVYPTAGGSKDADIPVKLDVNVSLGPQPQCRRPFALFVAQVGDTPYATARITALGDFLRRSDIAQLTSAQVSTDAAHSEPRVVKSVSAPINDNPQGKPELYSCIEFTQPPPPGEHTLKLDFNAAAPPELRQGGFTIKQVGPAIANPTTDTRAKDDFLDLGLTFTSSVKEVAQPDKTTKRVRTTRGVTDLFFAPLLNYRTVGTLGEHGGVVQVFTPFYIDAKVSTGKITKDTLSLNRIVLGSDYEFRHYLNTNSYPDLLRHSLGFKHTSDRDFKQDEVKFTYEFQPIFGFINQPLGSAPNIMNEEVVADENDKFGLEIVPVLGVELGRTYRVRDPKEFEGVSRNVRRFYFGGDMIFDLTKYLRLSVSDRFYVRGETPKDRLKNYFIGTAEAPLGRIGQTRAAHALFFSFERGDQAPFTNPSVNVVKFGYRIRARGLLF